MRRAVTALLACLLVAPLGSGAQAQHRGGDGPWYRTGRPGPPGPPPGWRRDGDDGPPPRQRCIGPRDGSVIGAIAGGLLGGGQPPIGGGGGAFGGRGRRPDC